MDDSQIIALLEARSESAIEALSLKYGKLCMKLSMNILGDLHDAQECVNDAYLRVWNSIPPEKPYSLSSYLCTIVRNISINRFYANHASKRNSSYSVAIHELKGCIPCPHTTEDILMAKHTAQSIDVFLNKLDQRSRVLFVRRYWHGDSIEELSDLLGISRHMVSVRLYRIREKLRKHLLKEGVNV